MAKKESTNPAHVDYTDKANELSLKLYELKNIASLASFAAEARRVLEGIETALQFRPEIREILSDSVTTINTWTTLPDVTGDVLRWLATQMGELNTEMTDALYVMASSEVHKKKSVEKCEASHA